MKFFGIDLGTSKCCVAYAVNSPRPNSVPDPKVVEFRVKSDLIGGRNSSAVPSIIARSAAGSPGQGDTLFGFEAEKEVDEGRVRGPNCQAVFRSVKTHLGTGRSYVRADPTLNTPVKVWAGLIRQLCEMTVEEKGTDFDPRQHPTVLTVPASFGKAQRDETIEAARLAGFNVAKQAELVHLIDEPVAALIDTLLYPDIDLVADSTDWNTVLVFDLGGGTCDLTLLKFRYDASKPTGIDTRSLAISPYTPIAGDTIDSAIMESVAWPQICRQNGITRDQLTARDRREIEDRIRYGICQRLKVLVSTKLRQRPRKPLQPLDWTGIKAELLRLPNRIHNSGDREIIGYVELSPDELDRVMSPFLDPDLTSGLFTVGESNSCRPFAKLVEITMERAGLSPDQLDLLVLHGGSTLLPFVRLGFERMQKAGILASTCKIFNTPDQITSVARGAALFGSLSAKFGKPYIRPIVPEDMSILTLGNEPVCLVHAADQLPFKKTFLSDFLLSSAGQTEITVPIYIGHDRKDYREASTLHIEIQQKGLPKSHPVEVELEIDIDKISRWRFRPKGYDWSEAIEVANPWIGREPTADVTKLQKTRERIRDLIDKDGRPPEQTLADEAIQAARAGFPEEGLALIEDVLANSANNSTALNFKAMIHGQRGEFQQSLESYEIASSLDPNNMVLRGNYGTALFRLKRHQEAVAVMREALSKNPSLTYLHAWLADAFQALHNIEEMNKELEMWHAHARRETIRRPDDISAWEELQRTSLRLGRYEDAQEASETIRELRRLHNLLASATHG